MEEFTTIGNDSEVPKHDTQSLLERVLQEGARKMLIHALEMEVEDYIDAHQHERDESKSCILVVMGADRDGNKELLAVSDGYRESNQSWREILLQLKTQGLNSAPKLAIGDGALGFWKALDEIYPETQKQRCWVHKTANVLNKMPKNIQGKAKSMIHQMYMADTKQNALEAYELLLTQPNCHQHFNYRPYKKRTRTSKGAPTGREDKPPWMAATAPEGGP